MKKETVEQRKNRIVARGEHSNNSHVICGDAEVIRNDKGEITVNVGDEGAVLKHILESNYVETGEEVWTKEHLDVPLKKGTYKFIQQNEFNPYNQKVEQVRD